MQFMEVRAKDSSLSMSKIILGTDYFGINIPEQTAFALMDQYIALGGNTLDTARIYGKDAGAPNLDEAYSNSEPIVGRWLKARGCRDKIILVTKGGHHSFQNPAHRRLDRASIDFDIATSLKELDTPYVDVYFLHRDDTNRPVEEIMDTLHTHVVEGRIRALGASNWSVARIKEANDYTAANGKTPFSISQIHWCAAQVPDNLWDDPTIQVMNETEYAGYASLGIPVMAFSSQARGYFSKMMAGEVLPQKRMNRYDTPENRRRLENIKALCAETKKPASVLMLSYITSAKIPGGAIVGCSTPAQLEESMSAADFPLTEAQRDRMHGK